MNTQATDNEMEPNHSPKPRFRGPRLDRMAYGHTLAHELAWRGTACYDLGFGSSLDETRKTAANNRGREWYRRWDRVTRWLYAMNEDTRENMMFLGAKPALFRVQR